MAKKKVYKSGDKVKFSKEQKKLLKSAQERVDCAKYGLEHLAYVSKQAAQELFELTEEFNPDLVDYKYFIDRADDGPHAIITRPK